MKTVYGFAIVLVAPTTLLIGGAARAQTASTALVSVNTTGAQANFGSSMSSVSADGRFVTFISDATNLVPNDTNARWDYFLRDRQSGTTERVNLSTGGTQANFSGTHTQQAAISADGRFVAFASEASNMVASDTNTVIDVFLRDRTAATTERVSVDSVGTQGNSLSEDPAMSADGRFVAFTSAASNLVTADINGCRDVFVRDRINGTTERVSISTGGVEGNAKSLGPALSTDGRFVAFWSDASNLVTGDTNGFHDIFVRDRTNGTTERVSLTAGGAQSDGDSFNGAAISADGRFVAFSSAASNLVAGDTNLHWDVFVRDRQNASTEMMSVALSGAPSNLDSRYVSISGDGRFVAFWTGATNLVPGDTNARSDIFVRDRANATTERVSVATNGVQGDRDSDYASSISASGRFVVFSGGSTTLVPGDSNSTYDIFVRDRGVQTPLVYCTSGTSSNGCSASITASANPSLSFANPCNLAVTNVEGLKSGILFYGLDNSSFAPLPWASASTSWLCVQHPYQRTAVQNSGGTFAACNGSYVLDWNAYQSANPLALGNPWSVGDTIFLQAWFRDPPAPKSTNLSNAIELTYIP